MENGISSWLIWNDDPGKMSVLHLFQIATLLNLDKQYMKQKFRQNSET